LYTNLLLKNRSLEKFKLHFPINGSGKPLKIEIWRCGPLMLTVPPCVLKMQCLPSFTFLSTLTKTCTRSLKIHVFTDLKAFGGCAMQCYNIRGYKDKFAKLPFTLSNCSYYELQQKLARMSVRSRGGPSYMNVKRIWKFYDDTIYLQMKRSLIDIHDANRPAYGNDLRRELYKAKDCYINYRLNSGNGNRASMNADNAERERQKIRERALRLRAERYAETKRKEYMSKRDIHKQFSDYFSNNNRSGVDASTQTDAAAGPGPGAGAP
jgi:hypothetical protein